MSADELPPSLRPLQVAHDLLVWALCQGWQRAFEQDLLLDLAMAHYSLARSSKDPTHVAIARSIDAAWLMRWRRDRGTAEPAADLADDPTPAQALSRAAAKYLATRTDSERWAFAALRDDGERRVADVKAIADLAAEGLSDIRSRPESKRDQFAKIVAAKLLEKVDEVALDVDRIDRTGDTSHQSPWQKLLELLINPRAHVHLVVSLALQCRGMSSGDAGNLTKTKLVVETPVK